MPCLSSVLKLAALHLIGSVLPLLNNKSESKSTSPAHNIHTKSAPFALDAPSEGFVHWMPSTDVARAIPAHRVCVVIDCH